MSNPPDERESLEPEDAPELPVAEVDSTGTDPSELAEPGDTAAREPWRPPYWLVGAIAMVFAIVTVITHAAGVSVASAGDAETGTTLAFVAIGTSILGFLVGLTAVVLDRGRGWGVLAMIASLFGNPYILVQLLNFFGG